ncbi:hypothetical protein RI129_005031 [Pyrocoelia pectoralis]|uniref:Uncharacterized protein n=1 Tax=Pyrocoelia pectoralis TaxID=417401 RepID=A0AAN7ZL45_9COLE
MQNSVAIFVLMVLWSVVFRAESIEDPRYARILNYEYENSDPKMYYFKYETSNGIFREEYGKIVLINNEEIMVVHGRYSYLGDDNMLHTVNYVADDKGYRIEKDQETEYHFSGGDGGGGSAIVAQRPISSNAVKTLQGGYGIG